MNSQEPIRIGVVQCLAEVNETALQFILLSLNSYQRAFQIEFLPTFGSDPLIARLSGRNELDRSEIEGQFADFSTRYTAEIKRLSQSYQLSARLPDRLLVLTESSFSDNYYYTAIGHVGVLAMGAWKRSLAPPSILEFIQLLVLRNAVWSVCPLVASHLGTRGCLFDFSARLADLRQMVFVGNICSSCRDRLADAGYEELAEQLQPIMSRQWLGDRSDPSSPAGILTKIRYDMFITKGLTPRVWELLRTVLVQEGGKAPYGLLIAVVSAVLTALVFVALGLQSSNAGHSSPSAPATAISPTPAPDRS